MRDQEAAFRKAGANLAAIGLGDRAYAAEFRKATGIGFPLLVDEAREAYRIVGLRSASVLSIASPRVIAAALRARRAGHRQHRTGRHPMQLGGSLVLGPGPVDRFVHVSAHFGDNAPPETLLAAVGASG